MSVDYPAGLLTVDVGPILAEVLFWLKKSQGYLSRLFASIPMTIPTKTAPTTVVNGFCRAIAWISEAKVVAESTKSEPVCFADLAASVAALAASEARFLLRSTAWSTVRLADSSVSFAVFRACAIPDDTVLPRLSTLAFIRTAFPDLSYTWSTTQRRQCGSGS